MAEAPGYRTLERAGAVLDAVALSPASAAEIARRTSLSDSTAHRLALALVDTGFLDRTDSGKFRLGGRFRRPALERIAEPELRELAAVTGETAQLWVRDEDVRVCLASVESSQELRATLKVGSRVPLPAGSAGQLLAEDDAAWQSVQDQGWFTTVGQRVVGLASVSAPVVVSGDLVAVVCLALPWARADGQPGDKHGAHVVNTASSIAGLLSR